MRARSTSFNMVRPRVVRATPLDAGQYLANYSDLRAAFGNDEHAAVLHYINFGYAEGRTDHPLFGT